MEFDDDFNGAAVTLHPKGWLRSFSIAFRDYKGTAIVLFLLGLCATFLDVISFGVILAALELFKPNGEINILNHTISGPLNQALIIKGVLIFGFLRLLTSLAYFYSQILTAKARRRTFRDFIAEAMVRIKSQPDHTYVKSVTTRELSRILRRECRYASRAITDTLLLPRPVLIIVIMTIIGLIYQPIIFLSLAAILTISLPFHAFVARWGTRVMENLLTTGANKSKKDKDVIDDLLRSPFAANLNEKGGRENHADSLEVSKFLDAYENRAKLIPASQLVSSMTFLAIFMFLGAVILSRFTAGTLDIVAITAILIGIRFASSAILDIASNITVIASYSPLISDFLDFLRNDKYISEPDEISLIGASYISNRTCLISPKQVTIVRANQISKLWRKPIRDNHFIHGRFSEWLEFSEAEVMRAFEWSWKDLSPNLRAQIETAIDDISNATEPAAALIAAWLNTQDSRSKNIFWDSRSFSQISSADRIIVMNWLKKIRLVVHYGGMPRNVPLIDGLIVWVEKDDTFYKIGNATEFKNNRESIEAFFDGREDMPYETLMSVLNPYDVKN